MLVLLIAGFVASRVGATYNSPILIYQSPETLIATKLVKAAALLALGTWFLCSTRLPSFRRLFWLAASLLGIYCLGLVVTGDARFGNAGLIMVTQVSSGMNEALVLLLYVVCSARRHRGAAVVCGVTALASLFALLSATEPLVLTAGVTVALRVAGMGALAVYLYVGAHSGETGPSSVGDGFDAIGGLAGLASAEPAHASSSSTKRLISRRRGAALIVAVCFAANAIGGFFITLPQVGGFDVGGADQGVVQAVLTVAEAALTAIFAAKPRLGDRASVLRPALAWCLLGLLLFPLYWESASVNVGIVVVYTGRNLFELCSWAWAMRVALRDGRRGLGLLCFVLAVSTYYFGAPLALVFREAIALSETAFMYSGVVTAFLLAGCLCAVFVAERLAGTDSYGGNGPFAFGGARHGSGTEGQMEGAADARLAQFDRRLLELIGELGLSEREATILVDAMHGYSGEAIGERWGYSRDAVKFSLAKVYTRAGVSGRQELLKKIDGDSAPRGD